MHYNTRTLAAVFLLAVQAVQPAFGQEGHNAPQAPPPTGRVIGGPPCNPYEDCNGPLLKGDCCLDSPSWAPPGWFFGVETDLVGSHIKNRLVNQVGNDKVHLPTAELDWTVSPRFEVGYRFAQGAGELLLAYKFLVTTGTGTLPDFDAADNPANLHSRLDINVWDFDYGSREYSLWPCWDMKWRAGVRMAGVFFDSTATSQLLEQHVSNYFFGAGPHLGLDLRRFVAGTGLQFMARMETAFVIGQTMQTFEEAVSVPGVGSVAGANRFSETLIAPWLGVQAGVGWTPPGLEQLTVSAGYSFECWWDLADIGQSRGDITTQGVFFRAEIKY
jgi:Legionella pneumophila major outer membrane protein precursor